MDLSTLAPDDLEPCLDLFEAVVEERRWLATEPPLDRAEVRARWRALLSTGTGTLIVAREGGRRIGLSALVGVERPELGMLVAADRRGSGVGRALLAASVDWARGAGSSELVLHVFPWNEAALALYRRHGFVERERLVRAFRRSSGERWDAIRMTLAIGAPVRAAGFPPDGRTGGEASGPL